MANIKGIVSALTVGQTSKEKPQLTLTLTDSDNVSTNCIVYTDERIELFAAIKDGDEIVVQGSISNGRFAEEGVLIVRDLNPELPEPSAFYIGEGIASGQLIVMTAGAYSRKSVVAVATATKDITPEMINTAQAKAAGRDMSWQEVLLDQGDIAPCDYAEFHTTRAFKEGDTKPALQHYAEDRGAAREYMRKVGVAGYAAASREAEAIAAE